MILLSVSLLLEYEVCLYATSVTGVICRTCLSKTNSLYDYRIPSTLTD